MILLRLIYLFETLLILFDLASTMYCASMELIKLKPLTRTQPRRRVQLEPQSRSPPLRGARPDQDRHHSSEAAVSSGTGRGQDNLIPPPISPPGVGGRRHPPAMNCLLTKHTRSRVSGRTAADTPTVSSLKKRFLIFCVLGPLLASASSRGPRKFGPPDELVKHQELDERKRLHELYEFKSRFTDPYIEGKTLGGANISIWKCIKKRSDQVIVLKQVLKRAAKGTIESISILEELQRGDKPHTCSLLTYYGYALSRQYQYLEFELCEGGDLYDNIPDIRQLEKNNLVEWKRMLHSILKAIHYTMKTFRRMHERDIAHRDLKEENIFFSNKHPFTNGDFQLRVGDFGYSVKVPSNEKLEVLDCVGTPGYWAPEMLIGKGYVKGVDMWAFGCILSRLSVRSHEEPIPGLKNFIEKDKQLPNETELLKWHKKFPGSIEALLTSYTGLKRDLISGCLTVDPEKRITAADALRHPYWNEVRTPTSSKFSDAPIEPKTSSMLEHPDSFPNLPGEENDEKNEVSDADLTVSTAPKTSPPVTDQSANVEMPPEPKSSARPMARPLNILLTAATKQTAEKVRAKESDSTPQNVRLCEPAPKCKCWRKVRMLFCCCMAPHASSCPRYKPKESKPSIIIKAPSSTPTLGYRVLELDGVTKRKDPDPSNQRPDRKPPPVETE